MNKIVTYMFILFSLLIITTNANAYTTRRTQAFITDCKLADNPSYQGTYFEPYLIDSLNFPYFGTMKLYSGNSYSTTVLCKINHEYMTDNIPYNYQWNQDNFASITVNHYIYSSYVYGAVCEMQNYTGNTRLCGTFKTLYGTSTTFNASDFSQLNNYNGSPMLMIKTATPYLTAYFSTFNINRGF